MHCRAGGRRPPTKRACAYPKTRKVDHVDTYHGVQVADPYRWLEDDRSAETAEWVKAQNAVTFGYLEKIPYRGKVLDRLMQLYNYPKYSAPTRRGEHYFFTKNDGLQNQSVYYVQKGLAGTPEVLIDPNTLSPDGTTRLAQFALSKDGKYAVVGLSKGGSDWQDYRVMEIATKKMLPDELKWVKVSGASWAGDGFFYSRYPEPEKGRELSTKNENHQVYFHKVGTPQSAGRTGLPGPGEPAAVPRRAHHRRRALRHPHRLRPRQGQGRQRVVRPRSVEGREDVPPDRGGHRRQPVQRAGQPR